MTAPLAIFVSGTDTGVGKTLVSAALLHGFAARGWRAAGMKPVAAGCEWRDGAWHNDDVDQITAAANVALPAELVCPYLLRAPAAPHLVAAAEGVSLDIAHLSRCYATARTMADFMVVEGVGGFCVPLDATRDTADLAVALAAPVLLVVGMRLGCLNHALLSAEACAARGLRLAGWIANRIDAQMDFADENIATLQARFSAAYDAPLIGTIPFMAPAERSAAAGALDFDTLLRKLRGVPPTLLQGSAS